MLSSACWGSVEPSSGRSVGERSLVFQRALMCRGGPLGCCRIPELGVALLSLLYSSEVSAARHAEWNTH